MDPKKGEQGNLGVNCFTAEQKLEKSFPVFFISFPPAPVQMLNKGAIFSPFIVNDVIDFNV